MYIYILFIYRYIIHIYILFIYILFIYIYIYIIHIYIYIIHIYILFIYIYILFIYIYIYYSYIYILFIYTYICLYTVSKYIYTSTQNHSKVYLCIRSRQSSAWRSRLGSQFVEPQSRQILGQNPRWVKGHWRILQHDIHNVNVWAKKKASVGINTSMNMYI